MTENNVIHGLWIGSVLSPVELLTINSFTANGHQFVLWAYDDIENPPVSAVIKDAGTIIPRDLVFRYKHKNAYGHGQGSYAGFSDIFRYKLLHEQGGIYVDMDITCLRPFDFSGDYLFRYHHKFNAVGNIMKCPVGAEVMDWCYREAMEQVDEQNRRWELPIEILNAGIRQFGLSDRIQQISNNDSWPDVAAMASGRQELPASWYAIHWMNEEWRRLDLDKGSVLENSNLADLMNEYNIAVDTLSGRAALLQKIRLSRWYYMLVNGMHRIRPTA